MGKGSNYYKKTLSEEEKCYSEPSSKNVDFYKKRIDELEDEIKMLMEIFDD